MNLKYITELTLIILISFISVSYNIVTPEKNHNKVDDIAKLAEKFDQFKSELELLIDVEEAADPAARKILEMGRNMALEDSTVVPGTCWTYANSVFRQAGFEKNRRTIYRSKMKGPYVNINNIKPGDWLYHINRAYNNSDHSGIFIRWINKKKKLGLTLSYAGEYKKLPGKYKVYDLSAVFFITRAGKTSI